VGRTRGHRTSSAEVKAAALRLLRQGTPVQKVAQLFRISRFTLWKWQVAYRKGGEDALAPKRIPGRPRRLSQRQLMRLVLLLSKGPEAYGFRGQVWTLPRIAKVIEKEFGVRHDTSWVRRLLLRLGFSPQKPELRAVERDDRAVQRFRYRVWPQYRRRLRQRSVTLVMVDESGKSEMPTVVVTWAPRGKTPRLRHLFQGAHVSLIAGITPRGNLHYHVYDRRVRSPQVVRFLSHLLARIPGRLVVFWDGGSIHTSKMVQRFLDRHKDRLTTQFFPAYAPDVNPQEQVWNRLKYVELRNVCPSSAEELIAETRAAMERIRLRPELFPSFFEHAGLPLSAGAG
jgi:transposase